MGRNPCCFKEGLNRGAWTAMEDKLLTEYIKAHGEGKWRNVPKKAGLKRCGKSCRLRWLNYLRPDIKRGNISRDEEELIVRLHKLLGNRWSLIAGRLPGRTDNEIKNYWNTILGKRVGAQTSSRPPKHHSSMTQSRVKNSNSATDPPTSPPATAAIPASVTANPSPNHHNNSINSAPTSPLEIQAHQIQDCYTNASKMDYATQELQHDLQSCNPNFLDIGCNDLNLTGDTEDFNYTIDLPMSSDHPSLALEEPVLSDSVILDLGFLESLIDSDRWPSEINPSFNP